MPFPLQVKRMPLFLLIVLLHTAAVAMPQSYIFSRLTADDGLRSNYVHALCQDREGFMWIGTQGGLQRYDGRQFEYFPFPGEPVQRPGVQQIIESRDSTLWVAFDGRIVTFDRSREQSREIPIRHGSRESDGSIVHLSEDSRGNIWLCMAGQGAFLYDRKAGAFFPAARFFRTNGLIITHVAEDVPNKRYWLGTDKGVALLDFGRREAYYGQYNPQRIPLLDRPGLHKQVARLFCDSRGGVYVNIWGKGEEFPDFYYAATAADSLQRPHRRAGELLRMMEDRDGRVWSGGDKLLLFMNGCLDREFVREQNARYGLDYTNMFSLTQDNMENIWVGTNNGIFIFNYERQQFSFSPMPPARTPYEMTPLLSCTDLWQHPNGDVWAASWGHGLLIYDSTLTRLKKQVIHPSDHKKNMLWRFLPLPDGRVLIGAQHANLLIVSPDASKVDYRVLPELDNRTIRSLTLDSAGRVWMGSQWGVLAQWDMRTNRIRTFTDSLYTRGRFQWKHIQALHTGNDGRIWAGTANYGLLLLDTAGRVLRRFAPGMGRRALPDNNVREIRPLDKDRLLIAAGGISILDMRTEEVVSTLTEEQGLPAGVITNLIPVRGQNVFFTSNFSAGKVNLLTRKVLHYGRRFGLTDESFDYATATRLRNGRVAFGGTKAVLSFHPDSLRDPQQPPDVRIHSLRIHSGRTGGNPGPVAPSFRKNGEQAELPYQATSFTIDYGSPAFLEQDNLHYSYRLEGIDPTWVKAGQRRYVHYTNVPPGTYTFRVYCENGEGLATRNITSLTLHIARPIWQKGWFYGVAALLVIGLIYGVHRMRVHNIIASEKVRSRIARDLHDDIGSTLTSINIMSSMARRNADQENHGKTREFLVKIGDSTTRMMESMDDIVWSINPLNDNTQRVIARMREFTTGMLEAREIAFSFQVDERVYSRKLRLESRHDFFMIYKEAITNIAKYAQCSFADVRMQLRSGRLVLRVQDNGIGFNVAEAGEGDGLMNMQRRAQRMNGQLSIQSQIGKGTVITLMFPTT
ncbi:sensor histidine kinase [Chitinophaga lutea]